jgi:hypothetical protein
MSKSKKDEVVAATVAETTEQQPSPYDDLLKNGTAILEAPTREALAELVNNIPADCKYMSGAMGRKQDGNAYTLRVDLIKI